ncbi:MULTISPECIES: MgtC/SapB family protein [Chroococcidiopsis]|uniref:MgtC/SapB transporter n=1 Tax=Chroococcidiopsis thermalis (strain PCC 7203) TaxID=251229 RepID=K9TW45_CHRTP|nr:MULTISPECIES: MgtC/SapB family protein [Chroococcidiopsis]AFY86391.1 MgtC/SapB transporter [Chroococcidiopsis thermalis PCC 7203]PSB45031.1 MgtC/SapB family protein [Cyanosarcina cf. burmensis CCALA 770]URD51251.1 MgtC/SapB family protein [Chroococcidiopsis sp. CCNUC1]
MSMMFLHSNDWLHIAFRLSLALLVGCLIGINRERKGRPAGMRTFMLVSMGAALFVMIPLQAEGDSPYAATNALSRTIQGVTTGVGFLGAGLILQQSSKRSETPKVRGLTTAASVWIAAALGAAIGCGFWQMGVIGALLTLVTLSGVKRVRQSVSGRLGQDRQLTDRESIAEISDLEQESQD